MNNSRSSHATLPSASSQEQNSNSSPRSQNFTVPASFQASFAAKMQDHATKRGGSSDNLAGTSTYKAPVHESGVHSRLDHEQEFMIYPSHAGGPQQGRNGYMYLNSKYGNSNTMSVDYNESNGNYGAMDYIREICSGFYASCQDFLTSFPRWVKISASVFAALWLILAVSHRNYHRSQSSNGKGDSGGSGDTDNDNNTGNSTISARNQNVVMHNCVGVGNYYFGDYVFEFEKHSYQIVGIVPSSDVQNADTGHAMLNFFDGLIHARMRCLNGHIGYLAVIDSEDENTFIASKIFEYSKLSETNNTSVAKVWLGGNDMNDSKEFQWLSANSESDGLVFWKYNQQVSGVYSNFGVRDDQSQNESSKRHCVYMHVAYNSSTNGIWWDENCYKRILSFAVIAYDTLLVPEL